jgi:hypothetical protein
MPASRPGTLTPAETAANVAYLLCSNGAPASATDLSRARPELDVKTPAQSTAACITR